MDDKNTHSPAAGSPTHRGLRRVASVLALVAALVAPGFDAVARADEDHQVTFVNRCKQQIWIGEFGSTSIPPSDWALAPTCVKRTAATVCATGTCLNGSCTCTSDADCTFGAPAGTTTASCDTVAGVCVKQTTISVPAGWSGRFWPRTGCSGPDGSFVCETGQCGPPSGGDIDCTVQGASANLATLFEIATAGFDGADNFDVSLVSGYNVPVSVKVILPSDTPRWNPSTSYDAGAMIVEKVGKSTFGFTNGGSTGTSGTTKPVFPDVWTKSVADGPDISWTNTGPVCETSGCTRRGIRAAECPTALKQTSQGGKYIGCDAPANACSDESAACNADLDYFQCQNNSGAMDLFGKVLTLQSPNAGTFVCFSAEDCPHGTTCELDPAFNGGFTLPSGTGVCTPVAQNGACTPSDDGQLCPAIDYPFIGYTCQTLTDATSNAQVCVPPTTSGMGDLWWNAANWTAAGSPPSCTTDTDCGGSNKCLTGPSHNGLKQCTASDGDCTCWAPQTCTAATCPGANQCLNQDGVPDGKSDGGTIVDCTSVTCYCGPQGIYTGTCGPTNPAWQQAAASISEDGASWPGGFKKGCPIAYSYQFDDPSSNWSCTNPASDLNDYKVIFCGSAGR